MIVRKHGDRREERGGALVSVILVSAVLASASMGALCLTIAGHNERRGAQEDMHARYVCQAGLSNAVFDVQRGQTGVLGTATNPVQWDDSRYYVQRTDLGGGLIQLTATGIEDRAGSRMELVMREVPTLSYRYGAFGKDYFHLDSNAHVDSYDSTAGTYAAQATNGSGSDQHARTEGDIGSNGYITIEQNAKVWGDAPCGPSQTTTVMGNAVVTGSTSPAPSTQTLPTITVPAIASMGALTVSANTTLAPGNYRYTTLRINASKDLTINGPATIVCTNFDMKSNTNFLVNAAGGPVTLYVIDNFTLAQNAIMRSTTYDPHALMVNLLSDNVINPETNVQVDDVSFLSNSKLYGTITAPTARIVINSNFELFGSLVARSVDLHSNSFLHFDESLNVMSAVGTPDWEILSWRTLPYSHAP